MSTLPTRWLIVIFGLLLLTGFLFRGHLLRRSFLVTSGDWRTSYSGFTYSLKFQRDGGLTLREATNVYLGTYTLSKDGLITAHIPNVVPWGYVGPLRFSSDGTCLVSTGLSGALIRYEHY